LENINKKNYAGVKKPTITGTISLNRLRWFGHVQGMEENRIPKIVLHMNLETTRLRGRPRNRWQDKVREDGRLVGGKGWMERVYNREEWKKLLRTTRNRRILHMPMELMNIFNTYATSGICNDEVASVFL
jgi:hypothetical protein